MIPLRYQNPRGLYWDQSVADRHGKGMASMAESKSNAAFARQPNAFAQPNINQYGARNMAMNKSGQAYGMPSKPDMASLAHSFQGMNFQNQPFAAQAKNAFGLPSAQAALQYNHTGQYIYPPNVYSNTSPAPASVFTPHSQQYMTPIGYPGYHQQHEHSPLSNAWTPTTAGTAGELPTLITPRRDSISSNEAEQPVTPAGYGYVYPHTGNVAVRRSPHTAFTHSSSSPASMGMATPYGVSMMKQERSELPDNLKVLIVQEPIIPLAIPAPSSPLKPLDRALENHRGETNVYIRGLLPETSDEMLSLWAGRFGDIVSSKSIIDLNTGLCKGFGFVRYHNYSDAEDCIRGFHHLGYEESFYSKLKTFSDETNTNLYVSNLPKTMNEHELSQLFKPHTVASARILRDRNGRGRGVGFARFDSRDTCEEVIKAFHATPLSSHGEESQLQIRYADTEEQKMLKQQTQAAREFRSQEYDAATLAMRRGQFASPHFAMSAQPRGQFDHTIGTSPAASFPTQCWASATARAQVHRRPNGSVVSNSTRTPTGSIVVAPVMGSPTTSNKDSVIDFKPVSANPTATSPIKSVN